jgi:organic radical activating enzyme
VDYKPLVEVSEVVDKINRIEDSSIVTLFGGEPGILDRDTIEMYISMLKSKRCTLKLETNGLFLQKYPELCSNF